MIVRLAVIDRHSTLGGQGLLRPGVAFSVGGNIHVHIRLATRDSPVEPRLIDT